MTEPSAVAPVLGWHWLVDAFDGDRARLADRDRLHRCLVGLPDALGLTRVSEPLLLPHADASVAGVVLIAESHFSLHARADERALHADLFSCARFDAQAALAYLQREYAFPTYDERMIERGAPVTASAPRTP